MIDITTMAKGLSKSRYTLFCQCPKVLWLRVNKPEEATVDAGVEARFESGNEVGDLAMGLFGPFVEVTTKREDGGLDLKVMKDFVNYSFQHLTTDSFSELLNNPFHI